MASNTDRRLDRLLWVLTPKERAILVLRAWKQGRQPNRQLLSASRSQEEAHEYNRIIDLLRDASVDLAHYVACISLLVGQLELKYSWFLSVLCWDNELRAPNPTVETLVDALRTQLGEGIGAQWGQLGALEHVAAEIAEEVDGEDVLHPEARALLEQTKTRLLALHDEMARRGERCELKEPTTEEVALVTRLIQRTG